MWTINPIYSFILKNFWSIKKLQTSSFQFLSPLGTMKLYRPHFLSQNVKIKMKKCCYHSAVQVELFNHTSRGFSIWGIQLCNLLPACTNIRCNQSLKRIYMVWLSHSSEGFYNGLCIKPWTVFLVLFKISTTSKPVILYMILHKYTTAFCLLCSNCVLNPNFEKRLLTRTVQLHPTLATASFRGFDHTLPFWLLLPCYWTMKLMQLTGTFREDMTVALPNFGNRQEQLLLETNWPG